MRKFSVIFLVLFSFICFGQDVPLVFYGKVVGVSDGDTVTILYQGNQQVKVRLNHIDAPEKAQPFGKKAKQYASYLCFGKEVKVIRKKAKDRYNRFLGEIFVNGKNVNQEMVKMGYAWHFKKYSSDKTYAELEYYARQKKLGLWQEKNPISPWDWRRMKKQKGQIKKYFLEI